MRVTQRYPEMMRIRLGHDPGSPLLNQLIQTERLVLQHKVTRVGKREKVKLIGEAVEVLELFHHHAQLRRAGIKHAV